MFVALLLESPAIIAPTFSTSAAIIKFARKSGPCRANITCTAEEDTNTEPQAVDGEAAVRRDLEAVKRARDAMLGDRSHFDAAILQKDEVIRGKDAEIARLRALAYGVEVTDQSRVESGASSF